MKNIYEFTTRLLDILISSIALIVLSPVLIPVVVILIFSGEREVLFFQERVGRYKKPFKVIKFATMQKNSSNMGHGALTIPDDPRILPFGKLLRKTKINELPQLINVLIGDMSIVGPRPLMTKQFNFYPETSQLKICKMRPGLTGAGSLIFRDEERLFKGVDDPDKVYVELISPSKALIEVWYYENHSLYYYFLLVFLTVWAVLDPSKEMTFFLPVEISEKLKNVL
ncbi:sugar transferase [Amylibacter sp.]|nr:sugar transferase [Amylibacter sp.]